MPDRKPDRKKVLSLAEWVIVKIKRRRKSPVE